MSDYDRIAKAISFINANVTEQPTLEQIASHLNISPYHFQRIFCRWAGVTPKKYLQTLTVERAKLLLSESTPLLDVSNSLGLSSGSRLYDHFVNIEAVTPGEFKNRGRGLTIQYGVHDTCFGYAFIAATSKGICKLSFIRDKEITNQINELRKIWPLALIQEEIELTRTLIQSIFSDGMRIDRPLSLHVMGTNFQINVWKALLEIPFGTVISYNQVANSIDRPNASRAVGNAIGMNPVAYIIPCHRVIQKSGKIGGYRWGETRKHAIHAWETAKSEK